MQEKFSTALSTHDEKSITIRGKNLSSEVMGELDFGAAWYFLLTGDEGTDAEVRVINAMLSSLMVHGVTPHAIATRMTLLGEPTSIQGAVASGLLGVGSQFVGPMEGCARDLQDIVASPDRDSTVTTLVTEYREQSKPFPGIGHPHFDPVDPRAERLFELASQANCTGEHTMILRDIQEVFEAETGLNLPINVTGAIAAVSSDLGLPPEAARGLAMISRTGGLIAEVIEEKENPIARNIWQNVDREITYTGPRSTDASDD